MRMARRTEFLGREKGKLCEFVVKGPLAWPNWRLQREKQRNSSISINLSPLVGLILVGFAHEALEFIVHSTGLAHVAGRRLEGDGGRAVWRQFEEERVGIGAQLLQQSFLKTKKAQLSVYG